MIDDERYMLRCLQLALLGKGLVEPNPMVGAVIQFDGQIIGEGYHMKYGEAHAEVNAVNSVKDKSALKNATLYVSLEPCAHFGKTPPCTDLIISNSFKRVVVGSMDPNPLVQGKGLDRIRNSGIEVVTGILKDQCDEVNRKFIAFHEQKRPYVFLKWARSADGYIDENGVRALISAPELQPIVHQWRSEYNAILVGRKTVENDDPELTVRGVEGRNPLRVIIDPELKLQGNFNVFDKSVRSLVFNTHSSSIETNLEYLKVERCDPENILTELWSRDIQSVMVEGGAFTINQFLSAGLWDEGVVITASMNLENGTKAPLPEEPPKSTDYLFNNKIETFFRR